MRSTTSGHHRRGTQLPLSRRGFVQVGVGAGLGTRLVHAASASRCTDTAVIQIWLGGGPSHIDLYDMKPEAPAECRGVYRPISTNVAGLEVNELLPRQATRMDRLSVIRSLTHPSNDHVTGTHVMQTGHLGPTSQNPDPTHPSAGSVTARLRGANVEGMLPYVHILPDLPIQLYSQQFNASYFGQQFAPFPVTMPFPFYNADQSVNVRDLKPLDEMTVDRLRERLELCQTLSDRKELVADVDQELPLSVEHQRAIGLITSAAGQSAFDLSQESDPVRDRYGRNTRGQGALLCRRLVEAGATFVTLNTDSSSNMWDHHGNLKQGLDRQLPAYDQMLAALLDDLVDRGLYNRVLVIVCGEFGRTPRMNERGGRDHWGRAGFILMGGGGVKGGQIVGATTLKGEEPVTRPITPADLLATVYHVLGIDPARQFIDQRGRPAAVLSEGQAITELL